LHTTEQQRIREPPRRGNHTECCYCFVAVAVRQRQLPSRHVPRFRTELKLFLKPIRKPLNPKGLCDGMRPSKDFVRRIYNEGPNHCIRADTRIMCNATRFPARTQIQPGHDEQIKSSSRSVSIFHIRGRTLPRDYTRFGPGPHARGISGSSQHNQTSQRR